MSAPPEEKYYVLGKTGWIGGMLVSLLSAQGKAAVLSSVRTFDREALAADLALHRPSHVLNAAGLTGRPNVDWCEAHRLEVIRTNVLGCLTVADLCEQSGIHHTLFATGCIFEYDDQHPVGGPGFLESDTPNFHGSYYSHTKAMVEDLLREYQHTLTLRVRMPISDDLSPRNFVTKIVKYDKVVNIPNSMTVLHDLLPVSLVMAERKLTGIYNFCNPGAISHNEVLQAYKDYVDPSYTWSNFTLEEQAKVIVAARSNNTLDHNKLVNALPDLHIPEIHEAVAACMQRMRKHLEQDPSWPNNLPKRG